MRGFSLSALLQRLMQQTNRLPRLRRRVRLRGIFQLLDGGFDVGFESLLKRFFVGRLRGDGDRDAAKMFQDVQNGLHDGLVLFFDDGFALFFGERSVEIDFLHLGFQTSDTFGQIGLILIQGSQPQFVPQQSYTAQLGDEKLNLEWMEVEDMRLMIKIIISNDDDYH